MPPRSSWPTPFLILFLMFGCSCLMSPSPVIAADDENKTPTPPITVQPTPDSQTTDNSQRQVKGQTYDKALVLHKPMPDPAWGKLVQYHTENAVDASTKLKEIIYCFVFQDDKGVVRVANYHENENGDGYWEVYQWDLQ